MGRIFNTDNPVSAPQAIGRIRQSKIAPPPTPQIIKGVDHAGVRAFNAAPQTPQDGPVKNFFSAITDKRTYSAPNIIQAGQPFNKFSKSVSDTVSPSLDLATASKNQVEKFGNPFVQAIGGHPEQFKSGVKDFFTPQRLTPTNPNQDTPEIKAKARQAVGNDKIANMVLSVGPGPIGEVKSGVKINNYQDSFKTSPQVPTPPVKAPGKVSQLFNKVTDSITNIFDRGATVQKRLGGPAYTEPQRAINRSSVEAQKFDNVFGQGQKEVSKKFTKAQQETYMLSRGNAQSEAGQALQNQAKSAVHPELKKIELQHKQATDYAYNLAKQNGLELPYIESYFRGSYKGNVDGFIDAWKSSDAFTKTKAFPTYADAKAWGLELKDVNPFANVRSEVSAIGHLVGMKELRTNLVDKLQVPYIKETKAITPKEGNWMPFKDPVFKGLKGEPGFVKYLNNLTDNNKLDSNILGKGFKAVSRVLQQYKFLIPFYHGKTEFKASLVSELGGPLNPKGYADAFKAVRTIDKADPAYLDYIGLAGSHGTSAEADAANSFATGMKKIGLDVLGAPHKFLFDKFIPDLKYIKYADEVATKESSLGRVLTDVEKANIIKRNQNIYGEMNEKLYGRSSTTTSVMRILFSAPGFGEGNFGVMGRALKGDLKSARFIVQSMMTTIAAASIGTRILTGKWPGQPKSLNQIRDLMKIDTGKKDSKGRTVMIDLADYDKDFFGVLGNIAGGQPGKAATYLGNRVVGAETGQASIFSDLSDFLTGKPIVDKNGQPLFYDSDSTQTKFKKFLQAEGAKLNAIPFQSFATAKSKSSSTLGAAGTAALGYSTTTSEDEKDKGTALFKRGGLEKAVVPEQVRLDKLFSTNPAEARKEQAQFNKQQKDAFIKMSKDAGVKPDMGLFQKYYIVKRVHSPKKR